MAEAVGVGGAEMGQRSARVTASAPSDSFRRLSTEPLSTQGTWMPTFGIQGLDVSGHQPSVDWQQQWNMGARFAYVKATEGNYYTNPSYGSQYQGSRNVGMIRGAYHFAIPNWSSGADQARYFVQNGGGWSADGYTMPPVLDFEFNPYEGRTINGFYFGNTCYNMAPAQLQSWVRDFGNTMQALTGRLPVIYTNTSWWNQCLGNPAGFGDYPLWVAAYPSSPTNNAGPVPTASWSTYSMWQYSSTGPFAGDSNVWNGDYSQLKTFASSGAVRSILKISAVGDANSDGRSDLVVRRPDGSFLLHRGTGNGSYLAGQLIGTGWNIYDATVGVGDSNTDGKPDLIARRPDGTLWFYAGDGAGNYKPARQIGTGWQIFDTIQGAGDTTGDGISDIIARQPDGALWAYAGDGTGGYRIGQKIGTGWQIYDQLSKGDDLNRDGKPDLVARRPDGTLWFYAGNGTTTYQNARQIGSGWEIYDHILGAGDNNNDGKSDIVAHRPDGSIWFYAGDGMSKPTDGYQPAANVGSGWDNRERLSAVGDANSDGRSDLVARRPDGSFLLHRGTGNGSYLAGQLIGTGWNIYDATVGVGDSNTDGKPDLIARRPDGTLWFYAGDGAGNYKPARQIGTGWQIFDTIQGAGDTTGDGISDIIARQPDGALWAYAGDGTGGYRIGQKIGTGWQIYDQLSKGDDLNRDGKPDLVARRPDGTLWFYAGNGTTTYQNARQIGSGWEIYDHILGAGDNNNDGKSDIVAHRPDGSIWFYAGDGMSKPTDGYLLAVPVGSL
ncbi:lysozyme M1 [Arthrobacter sp. PGP41]|nr:lysozyme M1 [Arthrobacter sp. PGP41]